MTDSYYLEDIQKILQMALAIKASDGEFSRQQLLDMADELEIPIEIIQTAEKQYIKEKQEHQLRKSFTVHRRRKFKEHLFTYLAVNTFLVAIDLAKNSNLDWAYWSLLGWGLSLVFEARKAYRDLTPDEPEFQKWQERQLKA